MPRSANERTVLILGAGVTRAAWSESSGEPKPPLDADFFEIATELFPEETLEVREHLRAAFGSFTTDLMRSLEDATSFLFLKATEEAGHKNHNTGFLKLLELITKVLAKTTNDLRTDYDAVTNRFIRSELKRLKKPEDLTIITFNYDLMLERVLDSIAYVDEYVEDKDEEYKEYTEEYFGTFWFPGGYRLGVKQISSIEECEEFINEGYDFDGVALLKLHGSMNWLSRHQSPLPPARSITASNRRRIMVVDSLEIPIKPMEKQKKWLHMRPIIVPPVSGKQSTMHKDIQGLWRIAATALMAADRVVVAGYSCPKQDIEARILISSSLRGSDWLSGTKRVYVIDPDPSTVDTFQKLCGVDHISWYDSIENWVRDAVTE